jgi:hypothetical protein
MTALSLLPEKLVTPVRRRRDSNGDGGLDETLYFCQDSNMNVTAARDGTDGGPTARRGGR